MTSPPRVLIVPGLHDSGPAHWQTWLQARVAGALRVEQQDWHTPDLERWSARLTEVLTQQPPGPWIVVAHSFGCLALARHLLLHPDSPVQAALLAAPAEPDKFGVSALLPHHRLGVRATLVLSDTDPWMSPDSARRWAGRWGARAVALGDVGHINSDSGFGPWPLAEQWVARQQATQGLLAA